MDFSVILPTFVITLREGVEAALVVGIVLACLQKAGRTKLNHWVYLAVGMGILVSALIGLLFSWLISALGRFSPVAEPMMEAGFSLIAIGLLSWMLIWMTQQASVMKGMVEGTLTAALGRGQAAGWGVFSLIFVAVLREGFETVVFIAAKFQQGLLPALGALLGLAVAAGMGVLLFKWGIRLNLRSFFTVMGVFLLLIVSGLVVTTLGHIDTVMQILAGQSRASESLCFYYERFTRHPSCVLGPQVWHLAAILPEDRFPGLLFNALLGYTDRLYQVQAVAYLLFLFTIGSIYVQSLTGRVWFKKMAKARPTYSKVEVKR